MKSRLLVLLLVTLLVGVSVVEAGLFGNTIMILSPNSTAISLTTLNLSRTIVLNASIMTSSFGSAVNGTHGNHVVNMTFRWYLQGAPSYSYNVSITNTSVNQSTPFSTTFNTANLPDGVYTLNVTAHNRSDLATPDFASNISLLSFLVDNTAPNVTNVYVGNITDGAYIGASVGAVGANYLLNLSLQVNDSVSIQSVRANLTTSSGLVSNAWFRGITNTTYRPNYVGNNSIFVLNGSFAPSVGVNTVTTGNYTPASINVSALDDGIYTIYVDVNDTHGNRNVSTFSFTVDRTQPSVSVSCTSNPTVGSTVTCTCSVSDATSGLVTGYGFPGGATTESTTASSVGSFTSSSCGATDNAGNSRKATGSWTTVASSSSSGSGPGGSPNGFVTKVAGQFDKKVWTSVNKGEVVSLDIADTEVAVSKVSFTAGQNVYGATLQVQKVSVLPKDVPALDKNVYKYVSISQINLAKAIEGEVGVTFKVSTDWLAEKGLAKDNVALHHFVNGQWVVLPTTFSEEDGGYVTYTAHTPSFSYFAIAEGKAVPAPAAEKKSDATTTVGKESTANGKDVSTGASSSSTSTSSSSATGKTQVMGSSATSMWVVIVIVGVIVIGIVWWLMTRKKESVVVKKK